VQLTKEEEKEEEEEKDLPAKYIASGNFVASS